MEHMRLGKTVFAQLMDLIPAHEFRRCVERYQGNYKVSTFSCWDRFLCSAVALVTSLDRRHQSPSTLYTCHILDNTRDSLSPHLASRTPLHLYPRPLLSRFRAALPATTSAGFLHHPRAQGLPLSPSRLPPGRQEHWPT